MFPSSPQGRRESAPAAAEPVACFSTVARRGSSSSSRDGASRCREERRTS
jgi:hypothetical protein